MTRPGNDLHQKDQGSEAFRNFLNQRITFDTNIGDFFIIAGSGRGYLSAPGYENANDGLKAEIKEYVTIRSKRGNRSDRIKRSLFEWAVINYHSEIHTLSALRTKIESEGIGRFKKMGYESLAHYNEIISSHGLEHIKVGRRSKFPTEKFLEQYGLEKAWED